MCRICGSDRARRATGGWTAIRARSRRGPRLLLWPGALFFAAYNYLIYVLVMPLTVAFLLHLALVAISVYTLIALLASIDAKGVQAALTGSVPERLAGGTLAGLGLLFLLRARGAMVGALTGQAPITGTGLALNTADTLISPAWVTGGVLLWRRPFGYVRGAASDVEKVSTPVHSNSPFSLDLTKTWSKLGARLGSGRDGPAAPGRSVPPGRGEAWGSMAQLFLRIDSKRRVDLAAGQGRLRKSKGRLPKSLY